MERVVSPQHNRSTRNSERGGGLVEFVLLVALIALICIPAVRIFGDKVAESFCLSAKDVGNQQWLVYHGNGDCSQMILGP